MNEICVVGYYKGHSYVVTQNDFCPCGYVGIDFNHSWSKMNIDDIPCECHGGITHKDYDAPFDIKSAKENLCKTKNGRLDYWFLKTSNRYNKWIGFDAGHGDDYSIFNPKGHSWTNDEMVQECKAIIDQAVKYDSFGAKWKRFWNFKIVWRKETL